MVTDPTIPRREDLMKIAGGDYRMALALERLFDVAGSLSLRSSLNLSDIDDAAAALVNLGLTATAAELNFSDGVTSNIQTQLDAKQALDATLTSIAALGTAADRGIYTTGVDTWAEFTLTAAGRAILDDASASAQRTTLGLGGLATQNDIAVSDIANGTDGELITWDAAGVPATVAVGASGQYLRSNGAGAAPTFQDPTGASGSFTAGSGETVTVVNGLITSIV